MMCLNMGLVKMKACKSCLSGVFLEIDQCNPNPCKNGGTCKKQVSTYKCECTAEFQGRDCAIGKNCLKFILFINGSVLTAKKLWGDCSKPLYCCSMMHSSFFMGLNLYFRLVRSTIQTRANEECAHVILFFSV